MNDHIAPTPPPVPTAAEMALCETYAKAKWAAKEAIALQPDIEAIVRKYGQVQTAAGLLTAADSVKYHVATLAEWDARIAEIQTRMAAAESDTMAALLARELKAAQSLRSELADYHAWNEWLKNMETFFKGTFPPVMRKDITGTVKYLHKAKPKAPSRKFDTKPAPEAG